MVYEFLDENCSKNGLLGGTCGIFIHFVSFDYRFMHEIRLFQQKLSLKRKKKIIRFRLFYVIVLILHDNCWHENFS